MADDLNPLGAAPQTDRDADPVETAWRIHTAIMDWMGKVDLKASITLTLDFAALGGVLAVSKDGGIFAGLGGFSRIWYFVGLVLLAASAAFAVSVVIPKLRSIPTEENFIYFGNLRKYSDPPAVEKILKSKQVLPALAEQLHRVSEIAWKKHTYIQFSLWSAAAAMVFLVLSFLTS
ncbi:Pycsar system effector family protein [Nocardia sp. NPDC050412]|uniref:Pycsar system effector family protein n=1 Tax=unclassified Nocardia TaxID=2637762 RepID=UPI00379531D3